LQWTEAYRAAVGEPLAFFHADVAWDSPLWSEQLKTLSSYTHAGDSSSGSSTMVPERPA
jgi:hypothetical protein